MRNPNSTKLRKVIFMYFILLLTIVSCGEADKKEEVNDICELNQIVCVNDTTIKTCIASDNGNIWEETSCTEGRTCEVNDDASASCNKPNLCDDNTCENSLGCTDGGGECKANTNGKNVCNTNDYFGDCAVCWLGDANICEDNKLKKCTNGDTPADADWVVVEECQNGCNTEGDACN